MSYVKKSRVLVFSSVVFVALAVSQATALGARESEARSVAGFDTVVLETSGRLIITQGEQESLQIEAQAENLADIVSEVQAGTLVIGWRDHEPGFTLRPPEFRLTMRTVAGLQTSSSGSIEVGGLRADSLQVRITSSGSVSIKSLAADSLDVQVSSSGSFRAAGRVRQQAVVLSSSGSCQAGDLACATANVVVSSSGSVTLRVSDYLQASVSSSGDVLYYGDPRVSAKITSSGKLKRAGN